jgi:hypothetical protein
LEQVLSFARQFCQFAWIVIGMPPLIDGCKPRGVDQWNALPDVYRINQPELENQASTDRRDVLAGQM